MIGNIKKETVSVCSIELFGVECGLLNIEDADIRVNIVFSEFHEFEDHANYDREVQLPNWVTFLLERYVPGRVLPLSAHLVVKASRTNRHVRAVPYKPFQSMKGVANGHTVDFATPAR